MKKLEELIEELGLKPSCAEIKGGRMGDYVHIFKDNTYTTYYIDFSESILCEKVIEVEPE